MDFSALLSNLMSKKLSTMQTEPGTTYGPAVSRISRTPVEYGELPPNRSGEYDPQKDSIRIDPRKGSVSQVTRHEQIHALLNRLPMAGAPQTTSAPNFMDIARTLQPMVAGDMEHEVPAYMAQSPTSGFYGISDQQRNAYIQGLSSQLQKLDPGLAKRFAQISNR